MWNTTNIDNCIITMIAKPTMPILKMRTPLQMATLFSALRIFATARSRPWCENSVALVVGFFAVTNSHSQHVDSVQHRILNTTGIALDRYWHRPSNFKLLLILDCPLRLLGMQVDIGTFFVEYHPRKVIPILGIASHAVRALSPFRCRAVNAKPCFITRHRFRASGTMSGPLIKGPN